MEIWNWSLPGIWKYEFLTPMMRSPKNTWLKVTNPLSFRYSSGQQLQQLEPTSSGSLPGPSQQVVSTARVTKPHHTDSIIDFSMVPMTILYWIAYILIWSNLPHISDPASTPLEHWWERGDLISGPQPLKALRVNQCVHGLSLKTTWGQTPGALVTHNTQAVSLRPLYLLLQLKYTTLGGLLGNMIDVT